MARKPKVGGFVSTTVEVEGRTETRIVELPAFEPTPWTDDAPLTIVGTNVPRVDAAEKVTGRARYTADVDRPGMLHAYILRARVPRGSIRTFDAAAARAMPGVFDVMGPGDAPAKTRLLGNEILYAGQPVAAVCASSLHEARAAAHAIVVEYDTAPFAVTFGAAMAPDAPAVRPTGNNAPNSQLVISRGDVEAGLSAADVVITREYRTPVALHTALEPHGAACEWDGDRLTVWESTQGIFRVRADVARALDVPQSKVRVIKDYMGGGFGAKNGAGAHTFIAALLARRTGRPVRCINDREAEQLDSGNRPATVQRVTIGAKKNGALTAIQLSADIPLGISGWEGGPAQIYHELYACPNVRTQETFAYVNTSGMQAFRGPGYVEGAFGLESAMNELARELKIDPLALRRKNFAKKDPRQNRPYSGNALLECYEKAAEAFGWGKAVDGSPFTANRSPSTRSGSAPTRTAVGRGLACQIWPTGGGPPSYANVRINPDASIDVLAGTQDLGTGSRTVLAQIAAEALGAKVEQVRAIIGDTQSLPYTGNSWGSMTTASVGPAVRMAAEDAKRQLFEAAAAMLNATPDALESRDSRIVVRDTDRSMTFAEVTGKLGNVMISGKGSRGPNPQGVAIDTFGVQMAEVEVDLDTGVVRVLRVVAAHDAGRIINPALAESQMQGGILQGVGYALYEERVTDAKLGVVLNTSMHDYKIPTMADVPAITVLWADGADAAANHTGARGIAEPPIIPTAPAIAAAVADAIGTTVREIPLTPWRVLGAMAAAARA
ncbi:MAG: xanthine dehydrogenase family protein molybdopterin-binding subunit [Gemmatimonadetes bacterium]|nr:xanthine dehydrogenase family protein molybdopterin-binding subunit [Gemmatimonadota bacterium]